MCFDIHVTAILRANSKRGQIPAMAGIVVINPECITMMPLRGN